MKVSPDRRENPLLKKLWEEEKKYTKEEWLETKPFVIADILNINDEDILELYNWANKKELGKRRINKKSIKIEPALEMELVETYKLTWKGKKFIGLYSTKKTKGD